MAMTGPNRSIAIGVKGNRGRNINPLVRDVVNHKERSTHAIVSTARTALNRRRYKILDSDFLQGSRGDFVFGFVSSFGLALSIIHGIAQRRIRMGILDGLLPLTSHRLPCIDAL